MKLVDSEVPVSSGGVARDYPSATRPIPIAKRHQTATGTQDTTAFDALLAGTPRTESMVSQLRRVAPTSATVLITGESGTGKEIAARTIHHLSPRSHRPFIPVNCGAISPLLIESELFGHEKGSFTGALREHRGVFEQADGGTLFLDEITEMPLELQVKLLRVLESRRFIKVGGDREQVTDVRIIAATNRAPEEEVASGNLREDLLYRLRVFPLELPALRHRREDIPRLAEFFLEQLNRAENQSKYLSPDAAPRLQAYSWPGNLRELGNVIQRAYIMADRCLTTSTLPDEVLRPEGITLQHGHTLEVPIGMPMAEVERELILATLTHCHGSRTDTAKLLGVSMKTLYNRLQKYARSQNAS